MKDETASTGGFELICEIDMSTLEPFDVDWSQYYRPRKSVTPTDDINDYLFEVTRQSSVEPCPGMNYQMTLFYLYFSFVLLWLN